MKFFWTSVSVAALIISAFSFGVQSAHAAGALTDVTLTITPNAQGARAMWVTQFTIPADTNVGHLLGSISGNPLDLSNATAVVTGLPAGGQVVLKPRTTCASGCDDFRFWYQNPVRVPAGTRVTITIRDVGNPNTSQTGWNYFDVMDSGYPVQHLAFSFSNKYVPLTSSAPTPAPAPATPTPPSPPPPASQPSPPTSTPPPALPPKPDAAKPPAPHAGSTPAITQIVTTNVAITSITQVAISQRIFYWEGSRTTVLKNINNPTSVEHFTLDIKDIGTLEWKEPIDLSTREAIAAFQNLDRYLVYGKWRVSIAWEFWAIWKVPITVTFPQCGCVAAPVIVRDGNLLDGLAVTVAKARNGDMAVNFLAEGGGEYTFQHAVRFAETGVEGTIRSERHIVRGTISDSQASVALTVNGVPVEGAVAIDPDTGQFEKDIPLILGNNNITATATSALGPVVSDNLSITHTKRTVVPWIASLVALLLAGGGVWYGATRRVKS